MRGGNPSTPPQITIGRSSLEELSSSMLHLLRTVRRFGPGTGSERSLFGLREAESLLLTQRAFLCCRSGQAFSVAKKGSTRRVSVALGSVQDFVENDDCGQGIQRRLWSNTYFRCGCHFDSLDAPCYASKYRNKLRLARGLAETEDVVAVVGLLKHGAIALRVRGRVGVRAVASVGTRRADDIVAAAGSQELEALRLEGVAVDGRQAVVGASVARVVDELDGAAEVRVGRDGDGGVVGPNGALRLVVRVLRVGSEGLQAARGLAVGGRLQVSGEGAVVVDEDGASGRGGRGESGENSDGGEHFRLSFRG